MLALGTKAPDFTLFDSVSGKDISLADLASGKATMIMFICNHCPFVKHLDEGLVQFAKDYQAKGLSIIAISSNNVETHPQDAPELMTEEAASCGYTFPYLYDESQDVAKAYDAACTPDFYLFDKDLSLVYRGRFDDSRPGNGQPVTGADMRAAADAVLAGEEVNPSQEPSMGCNIKWK